MMSAGSRSGVNCSRANVPPTTRAAVSAASVLARPGTPSSSAWPRDSRQTSSRSIARSWPTMTFLISKSAGSTRWPSTGASVGCGSTTVRSSGLDMRGSFEKRDAVLCRRVAPVHPRPPKASVAPIPSRPMRVLVFEDEVELADAVARGLLKEGYAVDVANDGNGALDRVAEAPYDVICLDLNLPDIDGLEVCRRLRTESRYAPTDGESAPRVLMLTARDSVTDRVGG